MKVPAFRLSASALALLCLCVLALLSWVPVFAAESPVSTLRQVQDEMFMSASEDGEAETLTRQHAYEGLEDMIVEKVFPGGSIFLQHMPVFGRQSVDGALAAFIDRVQGEFAKAWDEACQQKADGEACGSWSRKGKYTVFESKGSLTVVFSAFEYRGGAKRWNHLDAFSYTRAGGPLGLSGLFADSPKALQLLSDYCAGQLAKKLGKRFRRDGVKPEPANFKLLVPVRDGLAVAFPESRVASGLNEAPLGVQVVKIPLDALKAASPRQGIW